MTLQKALRQFNSEEVLHIGSKSAFFFIGTMNQLNDEIEELNKDWETHYRETLKSSKITLNNMLNNPPKPDVVVKKMVWKDGRHFEKTFSYEEQVDIYNAKIATCKSSIETAEKQYKAWKPFEEREVLHVYRTINKDGLIIILKGYESGDLWFKEEAERQRLGLTPVLRKEYEDEV